MPATPSQNAMKHGLTSRLQLPADENQNYEEIHEQLISTFKPSTDDELMLIGDMAFSRTLSDRAYRLINESMDEETRLAPTIIEQQEKAAYEKLYADFRNDPAAHYQEMNDSTRGVQRFLSLWHDALTQMTKPKPELRIKQLFLILSCIGSSHKPNQITPEGLHYLGLFLNSHDDSERSRRIWFEMLTHEEVKYVREHLEPQIKAMPQGQDAWKMLVGLVKSQVEKYRARLDKLNADQALHVESQIRLNMGMVLVDKERSQNLRLMQRYALSNANRFDRLTNKLRMLIDKRLRASDLEKKKQEAQSAQKRETQEEVATHLRQALWRTNPQPQPEPDKKLPPRFPELRVNGKGVLMQWLYEPTEREGQTEYIHKIKLGKDIMTLTNIPTLTKITYEQSKLMVAMLGEATMEKEFFLPKPPAQPEYGKPFEELFDLFNYLEENCKNEYLFSRVCSYATMFHNVLGRHLVPAEVLQCLAVARVALMNEAQLNQTEAANKAKSSAPATPAAQPIPPAITV
ncbi:MAG: hypothetical protein ACKO5E_19175 [bacterium]